MNDPIAINAIVPNIGPNTLTNNSMIPTTEKTTSVVITATIKANIFGFII